MLLLWELFLSLFIRWEEKKTNPKNKNLRQLEMKQLLQDHTWHLIYYCDPSIQNTDNFMCRVKDFFLKNSIPSAYSDFVT